MTGYLSKRKTSSGKEFYYINLSYKDPVTAKWKTKVVSTGLVTNGNLRRAQKLVQDALNEYAYLEKRDTLPTASEKVLLTDYMDKWLYGKKADLKKSTFENYAERVNRIQAYFAPFGYRVVDVTPHIIDQYCKWLRRSGKKNQKTGEPEPLAVRTVRSYKSILYAVFNEALLDGIITSNPVDHVRVNGRKDREYEEKMIFLTREELADLLHFLKADMPWLFPIAFFASYYGLRRSELLGLKWDAIDFVRHTITIRHTVVKIKTIDEEDTTKTPAGYRKLVLFPTAEQCLRDVLKEQDENRKFYGKSYKNKEGYVFTWPDGHTYDPNYVTRFFSKETKKFGRPEITLHKLRHTCVSLLAEIGWDLKKIQYWCGHKDYSTTANIYMHFNRERLNNSADDLAKISEDVNDLVDSEDLEKNFCGSSGDVTSGFSGQSKINDISDYRLLRKTSDFY